MLPLWCRDTSPRFVWWHHDLPCETIQSQEPHHEADRAACHQLVPRWRDGTRDPRSTPLAVNSVPLGAAVPRQANL
jgi:hypothetical protein